MCDDPRVIVIESQSNAGKGAALRKGFARATGDYVLIHDADLEYDPADWPALMEPILRGDTRVVFGSRFLGNRSGMKLHSYIANRTLTLLTKVLFGSGITDMETCYKLLDRKLLEELPLTADRFDFEPQITAMLLQRGEESSKCRSATTAAARLQARRSASETDLRPLACCGPAGATANTDPPGLTPRRLPGQRSFPQQGPTVRSNAPHVPTQDVGHEQAKPEVGRRNSSAVVERCVENCWRQNE